MAEVVQDLVVQQWMRLEQFMVRHGQAEAGRVADLFQKALSQDLLLQPERDLRLGGAIDVAGHAFDMLGNEPVAPAHRNPGVIRALGGVAGDVSAGITRTDDQDALSGEFIATVIVARMADGSVEIAGEFWRRGVPGRAICADQPAVSCGLTVAEGERPAAVGGRGAGDLGL